MNISKNSMVILNTAISYAQLDNYDIYGLLVIGEGGLYEVSFYTDIMDYCFYIDASTLEVLGFDASPVEADAHTEALCA